MKTAKSLDVPLFIGGRWTAAKAGAFCDVHDPSTGEVIARSPMCGAAEVDAAVKAALKAFASWSQVPAPKRAAVLHKYRVLLEDHFEELAALVTRENGKTLDESRGDVRRGIEVVEYACAVAELQKGETVPQVAESIDGATMREPLGVCAGISPFNFPAMVPMWMYPMAIACGNAFVLKPSEKVPLTAQRLAELFQEAGLPDGVFNIVHGGAEAVDALCSHPDVAAVSFVGSSKIAAHVYALGGRHGKRVQAGGGAKNVMVVMPDAEPDSTVRAVMGAAFGCAGQRCMAGSLLLGVGEAAGPLKDRMVAAMDAVKLGKDMGPVIDDMSRKRVLSYIDKGVGEAALVRDGRKGLPKQGFFVGPTMFEGPKPTASIATDEIFGPVLSMVRAATIEEAVARANLSPYGNGASIFTQSGAWARQFSREINCGMVGVNVGVPAAMALFPFSGWNRSFYGDLHVQGREGVMFYTRQRVVLSRWDKGYVRRQGW